ncbi:AMP-binding protein [Cumulibacter soli]|uniref:AMP-binding protein n=1 Tax=Cumulibacter soli TaxID=2546344 RepID=UPI0010675686|nr:AMP-binding protein [Cumulibacter soli]
MAWQKMLTRVDNYDDLWKQIDYATFQIPQHFNMGAAVIEDRDPTRRAITEVYPDFSTRDFTWAELLERSNRIGNALRDRGVGRGDVVVIINPQAFDTAAAFVGIWRIGAVVLPISQLFGPSALDYRFGNSGAKAVITFQEHREKVVEGIGDRDLPLLVIGAPADDPASFESALAAASPQLETINTESEESALLVYTSGTTGNPKGALHAHRQLFGQMPPMEMCYDFHPESDDVFWSVADWAWIAGIMCIMMAALLYEVPLVVDRKEGFDPQRAARIMREHKVSLTLLPATALRGFRASGIDGGGFSIRAMMSGGEALGAELRGWASEFFGGQINDAYGQTEMNGFALHSSQVFETKPGAAGRPAPGSRVMVVDEDFNPVRNQTGRIVVWRHNPLVMKEYWRNPEGTAKKFHGDWLISGDLGRMDDDGYIWFESRDDDVINSSGYRIGPTEIEDCLCAHDSVALAAVIGVPDERRGEAIRAFVVPRPGVQTSDELGQELRAYVRARLAAHEVPREIVFLDDLPRTATGKIMRRTLREPKE